MHYHDEIDFKVFVPAGGGSVPVTGSVDIHGGSQISLWIDAYPIGWPDHYPVFVDTLNPPSQTFSGSFPQLSTDREVLLHVYMASAADPVTVNMTATVPGTVGGACTPLMPKETTGEACAAKNASASQGTHADPVNTATGNFNESFDDIAVPGRGPALALNHAYNSLQAATDGPLGFGWAHSYAASLAVDATSGVATVHQETGSEVYLYPDGAGGFEAPPRDVATLVHDNVNGTYTFRRCNAITMVFSSTGQLTSITDRNGYATTLQYASGKLSTVTDPANRKLHFTWSGTHVTSVSDDAGRSVSFGYTDGAGNLTDYTDVGGAAWQFGYDGAHHLTTMRRPRQAGVQNPPLTTNFYDAAGRVTSQTDELSPLRPPTLIDYTIIPGSTKITDPKGNVTVEAYTNFVRTAVTRGYGTSASPPGTSSPTPTPWASPRSPTPTTTSPPRPMTGTGTWCRTPTPGATRCWPPTTPSTSPSPSPTSTGGRR
jgi:YD repeat-containing protein